MSLERFIIFLTAGFFLAYGLAFSVSPEMMAQLVTDSAPVGVSALVDFRATYGGLNMAVGIALCYLYATGQARASLVMIIVVLLSMAATRSIGLLLQGSGNVYMYLYLVLELLGSAMAAVAMRGRAGGS